MSGVEFTEDQKKAIETLDKSILVSAAAGSGKTAVLVERIINIIVSGKADVDRMLVVTFTNAAAAEMKQKIIKAIRKKAEKENDLAGAMREQLAKMYRSYISTFHSFALRLIKEFFYQVDIEPGFSICDEARAALMQIEAVDELIESGFDDDAFIDGGSFREFLIHYSDDRNENALSKNIISDYSRLRSMPDYFEWAKKECDKLRLPAGGYRNSALYTVIKEKITDEFEQAAAEALEVLNILDDARLENTADKIRTEVTEINEIREKLQSGELTSEVELQIKNIEFNKFSFGKGEKDGFNALKAELKPLHDAYKERIRDIKDEYLEPGLEKRFSEMDKTYRYTLYYIKLLESFEEIYAAKKREEKLMDFSDIEHIAAEILKNEEISETIRKRFEFIFIDEYQDTNHLQEHLISQIARKDNVFKVGDVKQSIYRFRQSEPQIFTDTREKYKKKENKNAEVIDLNMNFRSNGRTIAYINEVFAEIMADYDDKARLYKGLAGNKDYDLVPEIYAFTEEYEQDIAAEEAPADIPQERRFSPQLNEEINQLSKNESEAHEVAKITAGIIGTEFYDSKTGVIRKAEPRDIVVLMRSTKHRADMYYKAMKNYGIAAHISDDDGYFNTVEIQIAIAIFSVIDNMRQDIPLIAVLHSEVFGFSPDDLAEIRAFYTEKMLILNESQNVDVGDIEKEKIPLGMNCCATDYVENPDEHAGAVYSDAEREPAVSNANTAGASIVDSGNSNTHDPERELKYAVKPHATFYDAFKYYMEHGENEDLRRRARSADEKLEKWRSLENLMHLDDFIWRVLTDSGHYMYAGAMYGGRQRQANLRVLAEKAAIYRKSGISSLGDFIRYLDILRNREVKTGQAVMISEEDNLVRIMTIHKSKGLEFPFVIVTGMGAKLNYSNASGGLLFDPELGISLAYVNREKKFRRSTLLQNLISDKTRENEYQEELRVLYVAMTRAREKLILTGVVKNSKKLENCKTGRTSFFDIMGKVLETGENRLNIAPLNREKERSRNSVFNAFNKMMISELKDADVDDELYEQVDCRLKYEYPHKAALTTKAKYSVSELVQGERSGRRAENALARIQNRIEISGIKNKTEHSGKAKKTIADAASIGTAYHRLMEQIDFARAVCADNSHMPVHLDEIDVLSMGNESISGRESYAYKDRASVHFDAENISAAESKSKPDSAVQDMFDGSCAREYIDSVYEELCKNGAISEETAAALDISRIYAFFESSMGRRAAIAANAGKLKKEKPFTLSMEKNGRKILVQGVIDCCFEENEEMILLDYKNSNIASYDAAAKAKIINDYSPQLAIYSQAIEAGTGKKVRSSYLWLFAANEAVEIPAR